MKTRSFLAGWFALLAILANSMTTGQAAAYIKIGGVEGESSDALYETWSSLDGMNLSLSRTDLTEAAAWSALHIRKRVDKSSPLLFRSASIGQVVPMVKIEIAREHDGRQLRWWRLVLEDVLVASAAVEHTDTGGHESLSLNFTKITFEYSVYDMDGKPAENHALSWDLVTQSGGELPSPILKASGAISRDGGLTLQWPGRAGASYRILTSASITGPFEVFRTISAADHEVLDESIALSQGAGFFIIEEVP